MIKHLASAIALTLFLYIAFASGDNPVTPDACACAEILNIPTKKVGFDTYPLVDQNNEDFAKWNECKEEYYGYATATLECMEQK